MPFRVYCEYFAVPVGEVHVIGKVGVEKGHGKEQGGCVKVEGWGA